MNMKKTMAAIAAGAVAVSAMATSMTAFAEDVTFTYNLVGTRPAAKNKGTVNVVGTVYGHTGETGSVFTVGAVQLTGTGALDAGLTVKNINVVAKEYVGGATSGVPTNYVGQPDKDKENYKPETSNGVYTMQVGTTGNDLKPDSDYRFDITITVENDTDDYNKINDAIVLNATKVAGTDKCIRLGAEAAAALVAANAVQIPQSAGLVKTTDGTAKKLPFKSSTTGNVNIIQYLQGNTSLNRVAGENVYTNGADKYYINVAPVLNDAIANYEDVTFTFNTATEAIGWVVLNDTINSWAAGFDQWVEGASKDSWNRDYASGVNGYTKALQRAGGNANDVVAVYAEDWYGDTSYKAFTDHLYNGSNPISSLYGNFGGEGTNYLGFPTWGGYTLFEGALVVNEALTMSLADTDSFDWTSTSISFDWDAIRSNGYGPTSSYVTYIQSLKLATSATWYWDSLTITCGNNVTDNAGLGEGTVADDDVIDDDTDDGDDIVDDGDDDDNFVDDDDDDTAPVVDETPAAPAVNNPQTGNASVALAVIPVALAAAAVVAKKRG